MGGPKPGSAAAVVLMFSGVSLAASPPASAARPGMRVSCSSQGTKITKTPAGTSSVTLDWWDSSNGYVGQTTATRVRSNTWSASTPYNGASVWVLPRDSGGQSLLTQPVIATCT